MEKLKNTRQYYDSLYNSSKNCEWKQSSNWRLACHINLCWGECPLELAQRLLSVALAWHKAGRSTPFGVTMYLAIRCDDSLRYRSNEEKMHDEQTKEESVLIFLFARIIGKWGHSAIIDA